MRAIKKPPPDGTTQPCPRAAFALPVKYCYHGWMTKNEKRNSKHDIMFNNQEKQESKESFSHAILTSNAHIRQRVQKVTKSEGQKQQNAIKEADGQSVNGE